MKVHSLKTWHEPFVAVLDGSKTHEFRKNDRGFEEGHVLDLREYEPRAGKFTGRNVLVVCTHITNGPDFGIPEGYCVMSIRKVTKEPTDAD